MKIEKTNMSLINKDGLLGIFSKLGIVTSEDKDSGETSLFKNGDDLKENKVVSCEGCGSEITLNNFGHLAKGSKLFYCKNPLCFNHYIANKKLR